MALNLQHSHLLKRIRGDSKKTRFSSFLRGVDSNLQISENFIRLAYKRKSTRKTNNIRYYFKIANKQRCNKSWEI